MRSIDVPVMSQIVAASDQTPLLALLLKFDMTLVRGILTQEEFHEHDRRSQGRGIAIGKTTADLLQPCSRLLDLLDAPEDIPFMPIIQKVVKPRVLAFSGPSCSWPIGHPGDKGFRFCDAPPVPGKPYCTEHARMAYIRPKSSSAA